MRVAPYRSVSAFVCSVVFDAPVNSVEASELQYVTIASMTSVCNQNERMLAWMHTQDEMLGGRDRRFMGSVHVHVC